MGAEREGRREQASRKNRGSNIVLSTGRRCCTANNLPDSQYWSITTGSDLHRGDYVLPSVCVFVCYQIKADSNAWIFIQILTIAQQLSQL